jgi:hypothetical protein
MALHRNNRTEKRVKTESADRELYLKKKLSCLLVHQWTGRRTCSRDSLKTVGASVPMLSRSPEARQPISDSSELCNEGRKIV